MAAALGRGSRSIDRRDGSYPLPLAPGVRRAEERSGQAVERSGGRKRPASQGVVGIEAASPGRSDPGAPGCATPANSAARSAAGPQDGNELTFHPDHLMGADQYRGQTYVERANRRQSLHDE